MCGIFVGYVWLEGLCLSFFRMWETFTHRKDYEHVKERRNIVRTSFNQHEYSFGWIRPRVGLVGALSTHFRWGVWCTNDNDGASAQCSLSLFGILPSATCLSLRQEWQKEFNLTAWNVANIESNHYFVSHALPTHCPITSWFFASKEFEFKCVMQFNAECKKY